MVGGRRGKGHARHSGNTSYLSPPPPLAANAATDDVGSSDTIPAPRTPATSRARTTVSRGRCLGDTTTTLYVSTCLTYPPKERTRHQRGQQVGHESLHVPQWLGNYGVTAFHK
ncbi:hypothetical protein C0Q70_03778 [Pomacea canaliculata]|uniref:Uncharacterized protein n=1 Tax=Pomacea canaliculata TaxID=400727 RepID=A0A2T7PTN8_POMCA|nr:hypothetical protein C0Q70_03778 [Pomacea canaliculata]